MTLNTSKTHESACRFHFLKDILFPPEILVYILHRQINIRLFETNVHQHHTLLKNTRKLKLILRSVINDNKSLKWQTRIPWMWTSVKGRKFSQFGYLKIFFPCCVSLKPLWVVFFLIKSWRFIVRDYIVYVTLSILIVWLFP